MNQDEQQVQPVRPDRETLTRQRLPYFIGISGGTVGARGLSMHLVVIPPGGKADPHVHVGYETGIYVLEGRVLTRWGPALEHEVTSEAGEFLFKHGRNFCKRIAYNYFLRDLSLASLELLAAVALLGFGASFGGWHWLHSIREGSATPVGTIMIATVAVVSGLQFLLAFLGYDIAAVPRRPLGPALSAQAIRSPVPAQEAHSRGR